MPKYWLEEDLTVARDSSSPYSVIHNVIDQSHGTPSPPSLAETRIFRSLNLLKEFVPEARELWD